MLPTSCLASNPGLLQRSVNLEWRGRFQRWKGPACLSVRGMRCDRGMSEVWWGLVGQFPRWTALLHRVAAAQQEPHLVRVCRGGWTWAVREWASKGPMSSAWHHQGRRLRVFYLTGKAEAGNGMDKVMGRKPSPHSRASRQQPQGLYTRALSHVPEDYSHHPPAPAPGPSPGCTWLLSAS